VDRMRALRRFGHEVVPFDTSPWLDGGNRIARSVAHRFNFGPNVSGLNKALLDNTRTIDRLDLVWVDKGRWLFPKTLIVLKTRTNSRALHYTPDPQLVFNKSRFFERCIPYYEWLVTTKRFERDSYRALGARAVVLVFQGYDRRFTDNPRASFASTEWERDVCFVGHYERHYASRVIAAGRTGCSLGVWGPGWVRASRLRSSLRRHVEGNGVWGDNYLAVLSGSKIGLGLLSKWVPETSTTRSFEIPAAGTFLLAERTEEHQELFEEGKEAEFFVGDDELEDKIGFYLANEDARQRIALAGRERCIRGDYSSEAQVRRVLDEIGRQ
jgi:spore maturation protein CgeB